MKKIVVIYYEARRKRSQISATFNTYLSKTRAPLNITLRSIKAGALGVSSALALRSPTIYVCMYVCILKISVKEASAKGRFKIFECFLKFKMFSFTLPLLWRRKENKIFYCCFCIVSPDILLGLDSKHSKKVSQSYIYAQHLNFFCCCDFKTCVAHAF